MDEGRKLARRSFIFVKFSRRCYHRKHCQNISVSHIDLGSILLLVSFLTQIGMSRTRRRSSVELRLCSFISASIIQRYKKNYFGCLAIVKTGPSAKTKSRKSTNKTATTDSFPNPQQKNKGRQRAVGARSSSRSSSFRP